MNVFFNFCHLLSKSSCLSLFSSQTLSENSQHISSNKNVAIALAHSTANASFDGQGWDGIEYSFLLNLILRPIYAILSLICNYICFIEEGLF